MDEHKFIIKLNNDQPITVEILPDGNYQLEFSDGSTRVLCCRLDDQQDVLYYFDDKRNPIIASKLGRLIDALQNPET